MLLNEHLTLCSGGKDSLHCKFTIKILLGYCIWHKSKNEIRQKCKNEIKLTSYMDNFNLDTSIIFVSSFSIFTPMKDTFKVRLILDLSLNHISLHDSEDSWLEAMSMYLSPRCDLWLVRTQGAVIYAGKSSKSRRKEKEDNFQVKFINLLLLISGICHRSQEVSTQEACDLW